MDGSVLFPEEYAAAQEELKDIEELVAQGVLGAEQPPEREFCRWSVIHAALLPAWLADSFEKHGEIRWYKV
jgi:hypothetical protein